MEHDHLGGHIIDMHAHFFPEKLFRSIWDYFARRNWGVRYKDSPDALARKLEGLGVDRFVTYNYAHKPGMAAEQYERFLELWKDCDEELRPLVDEARQKLNLLTAAEE